MQQPAGSIEGLSLWRYGVLLAEWNARQPTDGQDDGAAPPSQDDIAEMNARLMRLMPDTEL